MKQPSLGTLDLPFQSKEFIEAWQDWNNFRKEIKKPLTPTGMKMQLKFLASLSEEQAIASIEQSIRAGWQGLFPAAKAITTSKTVHFQAPKHTPGSGF